MSVNQRQSNLRREGSALIVVLTLGFLVIAFKLIKVGYGYLRVYTPQQVIAGVTALSIAIGVVGVVSILLTRASARLRVLDRFRGLVPWVVVAFSVIVIELALSLKLGSPKYFTFRLIGVLAQDVVFIVILAFVAIVLVRSFRGFGLVLVCVISTTLLLVASMEVLYYLRSGTSADWRLMLMALGRIGGVAPAVLAEVGLREIFLSGVPLLILGIVVAVSFRRPEHARSIGRSAGFRWSVAAVGMVALLTGLVFPVRLLPGPYQTNVRNVFISIPWSAIRAPGIGESETSAPVHLPEYGGARVSRPSDAEALNVVLFILESVRARSAPPADGNGRVMPYLGRLIEQSLVAERMYTTVPYTTDALVAIFTGLHPPLTWRAYFQELDVAAWPAMLNSLGYRTGFFTSTILDASPGESSMLSAFGFEDIYDGDSITPDSGAYGFHGNRLFGTYGGYEDRVLVEPVLAWVDSTVNDDSPFVLSVLTHSSHHPYLLPPEIPITDYGTTDSVLNQYLNALNYLDGVIEDIMNGFEERGLLDSTLFIFVGDHGQAFGEHGVRFHGNHVWEETIRVPFILYAPSVATLRGVSMGLFQQTDIMPTILDLLDVTLVGEFQTGAVIHRASGHEKIYVGALANQALALITDTLMYMYDFGRNPMKTYDLNMDPLQVTDLATTVPDEKKRAVETELLYWQRQVNRSYKK